MSTVDFLQQLTPRDRAYLLMKLEQASGSKSVQEIVADSQLAHRTIVEECIAQHNTQMLDTLEDIKSVDKQGNTALHLVCFFDSGHSRSTWCC